MIVRSGHVRRCQRVIELVCLAKDSLLKSFPRFLSSIARRERREVIRAEMRLLHLVEGITDLPPRRRPVAKVLLETFERDVELLLPVNVYAKDCRHQPPPSINCRITPLCSKSFLTIETTSANYDDEAPK